MRKNITFYDYLVGPKFQAEKFSNFDSLFLAKRFVEKGLKVTLVDMEGVAEQGYDISNVVACDILGANCNANKMFGLDDSKAEVKNIKSNLEAAATHNNVTTDQMDQINAAILKYDCNYAQIPHPPNVTVLYSFGIERMLRGCESLAKTDKIADIKDLRESIAAIVKGKVKDASSF